MEKRKFRNVSVPDYLVKEIEKLIEQDPNFRYSTKGDFVTASVREKLEYLQKIRIKLGDKDI